MSINIHGSCVAIDGRGILLLGPSGAGKSDLALRLIDSGAKLVADDRCDLSVRNGTLRVSAPRSIAGLIELRGIGIVTLPHARIVSVAMAVRLGHPQKRLPEPAFYRPPATVGFTGKIPLIVVNGAAASAEARIRAALAAFARKAFRDTFNLE